MTKLATDVPDPPPITDRLRQDLQEEAEKWRVEVSERIRAVENITGEDLRILIR